MIGLLQRVTEASVTVGNDAVAAIGPGLLVFVGVERGDSVAAAERLATRVLTYRVFADDAGRMNRSLLDAGLELLLVPQFTLAADTRKGTRASFTKAAAPAEGRMYFELMLDACRQRMSEVASGVFGAEMQVSLINDGPVTFWLES
ncbi:MAG: D-aminoacyl-tRNA deacylase [Woeseiaceae bacterium]